MKWVGLVLLFGACLMTPVIPIGSGKSRAQVRQEQVSNLTPGAVRVVDKWVGEVRTANVRVLADDEYRAQHVRWQQTFEALLDEANEILAAQFGVRLRADYRKWSHRSPGARLDDTLRDLVEADRGDGVLVVIGLTSSLGLVTSTFEELGIATTPGRHLVVRGYSDLHERAVLENVFRDLRKEERDVMYEARRRHKTVSTLLHELGHVFGAQHHADASSLMTSTYSEHATSFDTDARAQIHAALDTRLGRRSRSIEPVAVEPAPVAVVAPKPTPQRIRTPPTPGDNAPILDIWIDAGGQRIVDDKVLPDVVLDGTLLLGFDKNRRTRVIVHAETSAPRKVVDDVVARAKKIGFQRVSVVDE